MSEAVANAENGLVPVYVVGTIPRVAVLALHEPLFSNALFQTNAETDAIAGALLVCPSSEHLAQLAA